MGLREADDGSIWRFAAEGGLAIVSKDSDFHQMSLLHGHPPKVVWLRIGNAPTNAVAVLLRERYLLVRRLFDDPETTFLALA